MEPRDRDRPIVAWLSILFIWEIFTTIVLIATKGDEPFNGILILTSILIAIGIAGSPPPYPHRWLSFTRCSNIEFVCFVGVSKLIVAIVMFLKLHTISNAVLRFVFIFVEYHLFFMVGAVHYYKWKRYNESHPAREDTILNPSAHIRLP